MHFLFQAYNTPGGNFVFPDHDDGSYVSIQLQAFDPDTKIVVGQATVNLFPQTTTLTLDSCVPNLDLEYSAYQGTAPYVLDQAMINGQRTISTGGRTFYDSVTNHTFSFVTWDDCNPNFQRDITIGPTPGRKQAIFVWRMSLSFPPHPIPNQHPSFLRTFFFLINYLIVSEWTSAGSPPNKAQFLCSFL